MLRVVVCSDVHLDWPYYLGHSALRLHGWDLDHNTRGDLGVRVLQTTASIGLLGTASGVLVSE
eukprot:9596739-Alexandrium_andersonii.AAC.1